MTGIVHVIGAGLAGLACAVRLSRAGRRVVVHEAAGHAGGRCRSLYDSALDRVIDNGNHLLMRGNRAAFAYLEEIGAADRIVASGPAAFPFLDLDSGTSWVVQPNRGPLPLWMLAPGRRVAGTGPWDYVRALALARARPEDTVADLLAAPRLLYERLWTPLAVAALNTSPEEGSAQLLWPVLAHTFLRGEAYCRPYVARDGLSAALVDPAVATVAEQGGEVRFSRRLRALAVESERACRLHFVHDQIRLGDRDMVVLAVPHANAHQLVPELVPELPSRAIVNAHFRLPHPVALPGGSPFLGLTRATAQWLFVRGDVVSVTVSAADGLAALDNNRIAQRLWTDVARALGLREALPPVRIINERRATIAQTPDVAGRRPPAQTQYDNLILAGDWTATGLPATIEGAIRAGHHAAMLVLAASESGKGI